MILQGKVDIFWCIDSPKPCVLINRCKHILTLQEELGNQELMLYYSLHLFEYNILKEKYTLIVMDNVCAVFAIDAVQKLVSMFAYPK